MFVHILALVYVMVVLGVSFIAWAAIVTKSGLAKWWLVAPALPVVTTVVTVLIKWSQTSTFLNGGSFSFSRYGEMAWVDVLGLTLGWLGLLVFAFMPWPGTGGARSSGAVTVSKSHVPAGAGSGVAPMPLARFAPKGGAASAVAPTTPGGGIDTRRRLYCPWCGEHIPGNRALGHDCGPKDRPEVICRFCGQAFPEGANTCPTCDA